MAKFKIVEHVIPGQHIREYPNATRHRQEDALHLAIKQYIPISSAASCEPGPKVSVTIIGAHGNGFPKVSHRGLDSGRGLLVRAAAQVLS